MNKPTKRADYGETVAWIAGNDRAGNEDDLNAESVSKDMTVELAAELFGLTPEAVATDVVRFRLDNIEEFGSSMREP